MCETSGHDATANAKLIAAAPEMLEALELLLVMSERSKPRKLDAALTWTANDTLARNKARTAIAKATA